jgi:hypothetical protein
MRRAAFFWRVALCAALLLPLPGWAHKASDSYLTLRVEGAQVEGQWDIALRDLEMAVGLDGDGDGAITWGELKSRHGAVADYALSRLSLASDGGDCPLRVSGQLVDAHSDGAYAVLRFAGECRAAVRELEIGYRLLFDVDRQHKGLVRIEHAGATSSLVMTPETPQRSLRLGEVERWRQFVDYLVHGIWHIWIGIDHILFLVSLLLPAVLVRQAGRWVPVATLRDALLEVVKIVTAFTVAHSVTLSLASLGLVELPSRFVESAIALSVVLAALNNVVPRVNRGRWAVAFGFGLIHGFGFASVLADLGLPAGALVLSLLGFNGGVELGQLAIVAVLIPLAYRLRAGAFYRSWVLTGGSLAIIGVAAAWFMERAFDLKFMPF